MIVLFDFVKEISFNWKCDAKSVMTDSLQNV